MGRKKKDRKASSSEDESPSSKEEESSSSESEAKEEETAAIRSPKRRRKQGTEKPKELRQELRQDRSVERSRWESPDSRKRRHSPGVQNQQKRRGHRERQDGTKWDKNERDREIDRESDKKKKEDNNRVKNERRELPERDSHRENNHNHHRNQERPLQPQQKTDNRENRPNDRFESRKSPRRDDRNNRFEERDNRNRSNNDRGRRGGRGNRFSNNDGPRSRFDGSRVKNDPSPEWGRPEVKEEGDGKPVEKEKPNFEPSGKLTEDANTVNGVVIKYTEPLESRKPKRRWRLYPFKGEKALPTLYVHRQSAYLMGRDRKVADIPLDHPSCSKQHAALQFRLVSFERENGGEGKRVRPYLIDLESANGTFVNDVKLEARRYHELLERDVLKFGFSSREYVLLHEQSKDDALDDDVDFPAVTQK